MDTFSLVVGFLVGTATGAAGNYMADRFTDVRREKKQIKESDRLWREVETRFPEAIDEMRDDFSYPENRDTRAFFVKSSKTSIGFLEEPCFEYHTDKLPNVQPAVLFLERQGFISDITPGNCPMYRMHEHLVDRLLKS
jgi:hypothetical protein